MGHRFPDAAIESEALQGTGWRVLYLGGRSKPEALAAARQSQAVLLGAGFALDREAIGQLEACRVIVRYGVGVDNIDIAAAAQRGVVVCNVPDYGVEEVADHALALLLALARNLDLWAQAAREGRWGNTLPKATQRRLSTTTLGVIGAGRIGRALIQRARAIWGRVLVHDPLVSSQLLQGLGATPANLERVLAESDFVTLHLPSTSSTRGLLSADRLASMKPGVVIVNCSRGDLVDEAALAACLSSGQVRAAGLDVFVTEPPPPDGLVHAPGVWPTPHVAFLSVEAIRDLRFRAAEEASRVLSGDAPRYAVTPEVIAS
jgi:phosphoglycerate dehydrogenase-like enzyme